MGILNSANDMMNQNDKIKAAQKAAEEKGKHEAEQEQAHRAEIEKNHKKNGFL